MLQFHCNGFLKYEKWKRCIGLKWPTMDFETSAVTWFQKSTLVHILNPELMVYRFAKVTIYLVFAFVVTIFEIFILIIDYQVDHQI